MRYFENFDDWLGNTSGNANANETRREAERMTSAHDHADMDKPATDKDDSMLAPTSAKDEELTNKNDTESVSGDSQVDDSETASNKKLASFLDWFTKKGWANWPNWAWVAIFGIAGIILLVIIIAAAQHGAMKRQLEKAKFSA